MSFVTQSEMKLSIMPERTSTFCQKIIMIHVQYVHCTVYSMYTVHCTLSTVLYEGTWLNRTGVVG